jgi:hypothetical protein
MNWIRPFAVLVSLTFAGIGLSEEMSTKAPRWQQLSQAHGFILGQQAALELIGQTFPDLAKEIRDAWFSFNSTDLRESAQGVREELSLLLGDEWPEYEKQMTTQIDELSSGQDLTRQQAVDFLQEVHSRAKGEMPESILSALLSANPRFAKNPELELSSGWKQTFRTKGHPKAKGVDFSISFPASWTKREGFRPNIIQFFQSGAGHGPVMSNLMVKDLPLPAGYEPSGSELREFFEPNELKTMVPEGGTFIDAKSIVLEGAPAGMLVSDHLMQRLDMTVNMRSTQFITFQGKSMIFIQFMVTKMPDSKQTLDELQLKHVPNHRAIVNTLVLNDRYE